MKPRPAPRISGFTLVELLTVIAIIAILASIIVPVVGSVRANAAQARDLNRVRTLTTASLGYAADNRGILPNERLAIDGTSTSEGGANRWTYGEAIERYLPATIRAGSNSIYNWKTNDVWYAESTEAHAGWTASPTYPTVTKAVGFGYNFYITQGASNPWMGYLNRVPNPSRTVLIAEILSDSQKAEPNRPATTQNNVESRYRVSRKGSAIYGFVDGHVALLPGQLDEASLAAAGKPNLWRWW